MEKNVDTNFMLIHDILKIIILKYQYKITIMTILRENKNCSNITKNQNYGTSLKYSGSKNKD